MTGPMIDNSQLSQSFGRKVMENVWHKVNFSQLDDMEKDRFDGNRTVR